MTGRGEAKSVANGKRTKCVYLYVSVGHVCVGGPVWESPYVTLWASCGFSGTPKQQAGSSEPGSECTEKVCLTDSQTVISSRTSV